MPKSIFTPQRETDIHTTAPLHHAKGPTPRGRVGGRDKHALTVRTQARPHPSQPNVNLTTCECAVTPTRALRAHVQRAPVGMKLVFEILPVVPSL